MDFFVSFIYTSIDKFTVEFVIIAFFVILIFYHHKKKMLKKKYSNLMQQRIEKYIMDDLTGIVSRKYFFEQLDERILNLNPNSLLALYIIDLDNFKVINDLLGHNIGDRIIQNATSRLKPLLNEDDIIGRFGGDEFIVLHQIKLDKNFSNNSLSIPYNQVEEFAQGFLDAFATPFIITEDRDVRLTASIGISLLPSHEKTANDAIKIADISMSYAKKRGKNQFVLYDDAFQEETIRRMNIENDMRIAVKNGEFTQVYQAIIDIQNEKVGGFEALIRWNHKHMGSIGPDEFIPIAEDIGYIGEIGKWVYTTAIHQVAEWYHNGYNVAISINVSAKQFLDLYLCEKLSTVITEAQIPPHIIDIELTETAALTDIRYAQFALNEFREKGMPVSLDDFGTGYSSLNYMKQLPFTNVKIDKSFIDDWDSPQGRDMITAIISIIHAFNMKIIAEGVETREQFKFLKSEGCDYVQGYFFSKPLDKKAATEFMNNFDINAY